MKTLSLFIFLYLLLIVFDSFSQQIIWEKSFGGSTVDIGYSLFKNSENEIFCLGQTRSSDYDVIGLHIGTFADDDFWLFKTDTSGNFLYQRCIGGSNSDGGRKIIRTMDGGYMLSGYASSNNGDVTGSGTVRQRDYWLAKTDSAFNIEWGKLIGGGASDIANSIIQTSDSGFLVVGSSYNLGGYVTIHYGLSTSSDIFVAKVSKNGAFLWGKTLGGSLDDIGIDVAQTNDGGYIVLGASASNDYDLPPNPMGQIVIFKLDSIGNIEFVKTHGGTGGESVSQIIMDEDGSFLLVGSTGSSDGDVSGFIGMIDVWVMKLDSVGEMIWQKCLGSNGWEEALCAIKTNDGGYMIGATSFWGNGIIQNYSSFDDCWIVKIDSMGNYEWSKIFGGSKVDNVRSIVQVSDHEYIFTGNTESFDYDVSSCYGIPNCREDVWMVKFSDGLNRIDETKPFVKDLSAFYGNENFIVRFIDDKKNTYDLRLYDSNGHVLYSTQIDSNQGLNVLTFSERIHAGIYILQLSNNVQKSEIKLLVN